MRKIIQLFPIVAFVIMAIYSNNLFAPYRSGKKQIIRQQQPQRPQSPKTSAPRTTTTTASTTSTVPTKTDAQKKQEVAALDKKINQSTRQLADAVKQEQKAQTPEEKKLAKKEIVKKAKEVLGFITASRNISGELMGYSKDEVEEANAVLDDLKNRCAALQGLVNELKDSRKKLLVEGWKGRLFGSVKPGKETEYEKITKKINKLEPELAKLNDAVRSQKIISGEQKFSKTRAFAATSLALAIGATGAYAYLGAAGTATEYNAFKNNPREYLTARAADFKNMVSGLLGSAATQEAIVNAAGTGLSETWTRYVLRNFGQATVVIVNEALAITKSIIVQATIGTAVTTGLALLQNQLMELIKDPKSTKKQIEEKSQEVIAEGNRIKAQPKKK